MVRRVRDRIRGRRQPAASGLAPTLAALLAIVLAAPAEAQRKPDDPPPPSPRADVFDMPLLATLERRAIEAFATGDFATLSAIAQQMVRHLADHPESEMWQAAALAAKGETAAAIVALRRAVALGLPDPRALGRDSRFRALHGSPEFVALVESQPGPAPAYLAPAEVAPIRDGVAMVTPENTEWNAEERVLRALFAAPPILARKPVFDPKWKPDITGPLNRLAARGEAAGNVGDLYDNRDRDHSTLCERCYGQLGVVEYTPAARARELDYGPPEAMSFNRPTFGNSSTALTAGPYWRSQARRLLTQPAGIRELARQYAGNQLYVYPEHRDHDPPPQGRGDTYPANTPYMLISQGSSGSDRPLMRGIAFALAALPPDTKALAEQRGLIAPTLQQIMRRAMAPGLGPEGARTEGDYLDGRAHPSVFDGGRADLARIIEAAQAIRADALPPAVRLSVLQDPRPTPGRDMFSGGLGEQLFDTPSAIARIHRSVANERRMVVTTAGTEDPNGRPLRFEWRVLRGDAERIRIEPRDPEGRTAVLTIPWHDPYPVPGRPGLMTHRVDIGVFAHNGVAWSAPAFVSVAFSPAEQRRYDADGRVLSIEYPDGTRAEAYTDPLLFVGQGWTDTYAYDDEGRMTGWTRRLDSKPGAEPLEFAPDGTLVLKRDSLDRPTLTAEVTYRREQPRPGLTRLEMVQTGVRSAIWYDGPEDRTGNVIRIKPEGN